MPRLQRQPLFQLVAGQLDLILIVIHTRPMVVENRRIRGVQLQRPAELKQRLVVHPVAAQRHPGHHMHVPVIGRSRQQVRDSVARGFFFSAR